jgi:hypothetical protein
MRHWPSPVLVDTGFAYAAVAVCSFWFGVR